jgi:hypothetical protein
LRAKEKAPSENLREVVQGGRLWGCETNQRCSLWHEIDIDDKFIEQAEQTDADMAARVKALGCPYCEGRLDRADYPRKPRCAGLSGAGEAVVRRISLCCARDGCRRRVTPPSVVFLGRRVYLGIVVLLASLRATERPSSAPPARTVRRWIGWFQGVVPRAPVLTAARALLVPPIEDPTTLPGSLVERFTPRRRLGEALQWTLRWLAPLTTTSVRDCARFLMGHP